MTWSYHNLETIHDISMHDFNTCEYYAFTRVPMLPSRAVKSGKNNSKAVIMDAYLRPDLNAQPSEAFQVTLAWAIGDRCTPHPSKMCRDVHNYFFADWYFRVETWKCVSLRIVMIMYESFTKAQDLIQKLSTVPSIKFSHETPIYWLLDIHGGNMETLVVELYYSRRTKDFARATKR